MKRALAIALPLAAFVAGAGHAAAPATSAETLLRDTDLFARAPKSFRAAMTLGAPGAAGGMALELFRRGDDRALVRLVESGARGRVFLRRGDATWLIAPGAAKPLQVTGAMAIAGASLSELFGLALARDYAIESYAVDKGVGTFQLAARAATSPAPRLRYVVDPAKRLPLRAELLARDGRLLRLLRFEAWRDEKSAIPARLLVQDVLATGRAVEIRIDSFAPIELADAFFALDEAGSAERARAFAER